ncbi:MAG: O-methyltransferase YrrM [archaeon GW2011_AR5]|nr:MAG: O-methyltransferase YrrM [archaeon GW2011_AR5]
MIFNKADKVLREIEKAAEAQNKPGNVALPIIGREKGTVLENIIKEAKPDAVLEIGTLVGYSAILMAKNMKKGKIVTIEFNSRNFEAAKLNIERAGFRDKIEVMNGDALKIVPNLEDEFDMVFIDAEKKDYFKYLKAAEPKTTKNATVVADNAKRFANDMKDFLDYVRNSGNYRSELRDFGADGVEVSRRIR